MVNITNILIDVRRGSGSPTEILYGTVTFKPTLAHSRSTSLVLPAPTTYDLVSGQVVATNVQPTPEPVEGQIEWAYEVTFKDRHSKSYSFIVGVPDSTTQVNFISLPRYFETKPPLFGQGPKGEPGEAATVAVGTVEEGTEASVTNSGTNTDAVLNFVLPEGPQGPKGDGVELRDTLVTDLPDSYIAGTTYGNVSSAAGWPIGFALVVTERRFSGRVTQTITSSSRQLIRNASSNTWLEWREIPTNALATTTANGLMSSADKVRLDDFGSLPIRSKSATDAPSTYPSGTSVVVVDPLDGWPQIPDGSATVVQVTTHKTKDRSGGTLQWVSSFINAESDVLFRTALDNGTWGSFRKLAVNDGSLSHKGDTGVLASDYGAPGATVGDGVNNDFHTIQRAIDAANGKDVWLEGDKTYFIGGTLSMPRGGGNRVSLRTLGPKPAKLLLGASGQSYNAIKFEQTTMAAQTTLTKAIGQNQHGWTVASTAGIQPGMICEVISTVLWYFDARESAKKSELHKVKQVIGNKVYFQDPSMDGYATVGETVTLSFYQPIYVNIENIEVVGVLPVIAQETGASTGIEVHHADSPTLSNVNTDSCARTGIYLHKCYRPKVVGGQSIRSNNYYNGYGVALSGCTHAIIRDRFNYHGRRAVDVSGSDVVSRMTTIENCTAVGGGWDSRGTAYGFTEEGTTGSPQFGFGSHGPADQTRYVNCTTLGIQRPYIVRGRDEVIENMRHVGRTHGGVIQLSFGSNIFVSGGVVTSGTWSYKNGAPQIEGQSQATWRPDYFIRNYPGYQVNPPAGSQRGRIIIKGVTAEVNHIFMWLSNGADPGGVPLGALTIADCDIQFWAEDATRTKYLIWSDATDSGSTSKSRWFLGPNRMTSDAGAAAPILLNFGLNLTSANILNYTVQT